MNGSIRVSQKHGVNPSLMVCMVCGKDTGVALHGALPGDAEAPRHTPDVSPCDACKKEIEGYKEMGFVLFVVSDEVHDYPKASPWQFFRWLSVLKMEAAERMFKDMDMSKRCAFLTEATAKQIGIPKPEK